MQNYVQDGDTITVVSTAAKNAGDGVLAGGLFGVAHNTVDAAGEDIEMKTTGVFALTKSSGAGTAIAAYGKAYWDDTAKAVTGVATDNTLIGVALAAAADGDVVATVRLNGVSI